MKKLEILLIPYIIFMASAMSVDAVHHQYHSKCKLTDLLKVTKYQNVFSFSSQLNETIVLQLFPLGSKVEEQ